MLKIIWFLFLFFRIQNASAEVVSAGIIIGKLTISWWTVTYVVISLASIGYSLYQARQADKNKAVKAKYANSVIENTYSNEGIVPIIYGGSPQATGGNIVWQSDPGLTVQRFLALCIGEVSAITNITLDEVDIATLAGCSYTAYYGTTTQDVDSRGSGTVKGLRDLAYLAVTITAGEKVSGDPTAACYVTGRKIQTWNSGTELWTTNALASSSNPAAIIRDYLLLSAVVGGCGIPSTFIDDASFGAASEICDELVNNGTGGTETRYNLDIILDTKHAVLDNLNKMLITCNMAILYSGNQYKIAIEKANDTAVQAFTEDNITKGSFSYGYGKADETPNKVGIQWVSALELINEKRMVWAEDEIDQDIRGIREETIETVGIIRQSQASRLAKKLMYERKLNDVWCKFDSNISALHCEPFDIISVAHSRPNWTAALFRIIEITEVAFGKASYLCQAYNSSVLDDKYGTTFTDWDYGAPPNPYTAVTDVTGIVLEEVGWRNTDGTHIAHIDVSWAAPASKKEFLSSYIIELKKGTDEYIPVGSVPSNQTNYRINLNLEIYYNYYVKIKTYSINSITSDGTVSSVITLVGKDVAPSDVTAFIVKKYRDIILCKWTKVSDVDVNKYEIRKGTDWNSSDIVDTPIYGDMLTIRDIKIGTDQSYWIKAIDNSGNYSVNAKEAMITIGEIPFQNIVLSTSDQTGWAGTHVNTEVDGNNLVLSATFLSGTYTTLVKDIGYICDARIMITGVATTSEGFAWDTDPYRAFDDSQTLRFTGTESPSALSYEIRTSTDNIIWRDWGSWITADYNCRYFQIRMTVTRESLSSELLVSALNIDADLPDVDETGTDTVSVAGDGKAVTFTKTYHVAPLVNVNITSGDGYVNKFSVNPTITGFTAKLYALDGTAKTGDFSWASHGI